MKRNRPLPRTNSRRARRWLAGSSLLAAGAAGGGLWASSTTAGASTVTAASSTSSASGSAGTGSSNGSTGQPPATGAGHPYGLNESGTVTAVGSSSVTIKSSSGQTTTYAVVSNSDIDKNGEAELSNLVVGDKVTFDYVTSGSTKTIAHLHAGSEALDRPTPDGNGTGSGNVGGLPAGPPPAGSAGYTNPA